MITQSEHMVGNLDVVVEDYIGSSNLIIHPRPIREDQCTGDFLIKNIPCDALFVPWRYETVEEGEGLCPNDQILGFKVLYLILEEVEYLRIF
ncbi:hypothetical protein CEXT_795221 [Caerostris extrusa]|uniref:Uncharacterized protein n=1 Tax=Caerostris extrusa TaxID=172846 RepID=A0AAV4S9E4_CAEEX|nr:hypothetical protein CEXT_795221 [Caerostris extrusa]